MFRIAKMCLFSHRTIWVLRKAAGHEPSQIFCVSEDNLLKKRDPRDTWVAQSVERPTSTRVMISQLMSSSRASGSVLTSQSLEPASDAVSPSLSLPLPCSCSVSLSVSKIKILFFLIKKRKKENGQRHTRTSPRRRHTNGSHAHEHIFNIISH